MKLILLAAGSGRRLMPYTRSKPKCMVEIKGQPLLNYHLDVLSGFVFEKMIAVKGYCAGKISEENFHYYLNEQFDSTNMVWSLFCARQELDSPFVLCYGDIVYAQGIMEKLISDTSDISVVIDRNWKSYWEMRFEHPLDDAESLRLSDDGHITSIGRKVESYEEIQGQFIGLLKFSQRGASIISSVLDDCYRNNLPVCGKSFRNAYTTDLIQEIINRGYAVKAVVTEEPWIEIDTVGDLMLPENERRLNLITSNLKKRVYST